MSKQKPLSFPEEYIFVDEDTYISIKDALIHKAKKNHKPIITIGTYGYGYKGCPTENGINLELKNLDNLIKTEKEQIENIFKNFNIK